jgi:hypothetical protein
MCELVLVKGELPLADLTLPGIVLWASVAQDYHVLNYIIYDDRVGSIVINMYIQMSVYGVREILHRRCLIDLMRDNSLFFHQFLHIGPDLSECHVQFLRLTRQTCKLCILIQCIRIGNLQNYRELTVEVGMKIKPNVFVNISYTSEFEELVYKVDNIFEIH